MARKLRVEYPGAVYHVIDRGNQGDGDDRQMDCGAIADGNAGLCAPSLIPPKDKCSPQKAVNMTISGPVVEISQL